MHRRRMEAVGALDPLEFGAVGAVEDARIGKSGTRIGGRVVAVEMERRGDAWPRLEPGHLERGLDGVVRHAAIGRPLATGHRHETARRDLDHMLARDLLRGLLVGGARQRPQPREDREDVRLGRRLREIAARVPQDEADLLGARARLEFGLAHLGVGRSDERAAVPRNDEEDASVVGVRHHDRVVRGQEFPRKDEVDAARGLDRRRGAGALHAADPVGEHARRVHDDRAADDRVVPVLEIGRADADDLPVVDEESVATHARDDARAVRRRRLREGERHARVVELRVVVLDAAEEPFVAHARDRRDRLLAREEAALPEVPLAGERVVEPEPSAVERPFPPVVARHDEREVVDEVRRIRAERRAFLERFGDETEVELLEVADAAVDELRAARTRRLREVVLLDERGAVAARGGVDGDAETGRAPADDDEVEVVRRERGEMGGAFEGAFHVVLAGRDGGRSTRRARCVVLAGGFS